jgi:tetratricopeptide (TPR) repeat protein
LPGRRPAGRFKAEFWSMRTAASILILVALAAPASAQQSEADRLSACIAKIETAPAEAYEDALAWMGVGARPGARHCAALALVALGQEAEGAARLEALANAKDGGTLEARAVYLAQSGNAWLLAGAPEAAVTTLSNAIKLAPQDAGLRIDRARAQLILKKWAEAGKDLDAAIELSPGDAEAHTLRAQALKEMGRLDEAWADVQAALKIDPNAEGALLLRGQVREAMRLAGQADPAGAAPEPAVRPRIVGQ